MKILKCGTLITPDSIQKDKYLCIENGKITAIKDSINPSQEKSVIDVSDKIVGPGLVDIHCHGALNTDFSDGDPEGITKASEYHLQMGTTTLLGTIGSCMPDEMTKAMDTIRALTR